MRGLNLDHLRAFADVAELGSFSAAAERLNLTQPAVSLQIRQLEQRLRVKLFFTYRGPLGVESATGDGVLTVEILG